MQPKLVPDMSRLVLTGASTVEWRDVGGDQYAEEAIDA